MIIILWLILDQASKGDLSMIRSSAISRNKLFQFIITLLKIVLETTYFSILYLQLVNMICIKLY